MRRLAKAIALLALALCISIAGTRADITVQAWFHLGEPGSAGPQNRPLDASGNARHFQSDEHGGNVVVSALAPAPGSTASFEFNGVDQSFADIGYDAPEDNVGVEVWVRVARLDQTNAFIFGTDSLAAGLGLGYGDPSNGLQAVVGGGAWVGPGYLPGSTNEWVHLAVVRDGGLTTFYVNGAPRGATVPDAPLDGTVVRLAGTSDGAAHFNGAVDEARIFTFAPGAFSTNDLLVFNIPVSITTQPQSQIVNELAPVTFSGAVSGSAPISLQWLRNGVPLSGATNLSLTFPSAQLADDGADFSLAATNTTAGTVSTAVSRNATLRVLADTNPPVLLQVQPLPAAQLRVLFSDRLSPATATNPANYALACTNGPASISAATLDASQSNVELSVTGLIENAFYTLTVNALRDPSAAGNLIAANSSIAFFATTYAPGNVGASAPPGSVTPVLNGYTVAGGGADLGGTADQCQFNYQLRTGDFDVKVRVESLSFADAWTRAGLMARASLAPNTLFASTVATPSIAGACFQSRVTAGTMGGATGSMPVSYPNQWLRLRRAGATFSGYGSYDGVNWSLLGSATFGMPGTVYLGLVVSSHQTNRLATAAFRDLAEATGTGFGSFQPRTEPLGPSSRRSGLVISEIMYHPAARIDGRELEFIELFNSQSIAEDLTGYRLTGDPAFTFPPGTVLAPGAFLVVAKSPADLQAVYGLTNVIGPFTNALPNNVGTVQLRNELGALLAEVSYDTRRPWPVAPDGTGHSLVLARPSYGEADARAWAASDAFGGSPGRPDPITADPLDEVVINEFLAHTDPPLEDYVELYNHTGQLKDLSGAWLSDEAATNKFRIPDATVLPAGGFRCFTATELGFNLSSAGERIYLVNSNRTRVLDAIDFGPQENAVSCGRVPDGGREFYRLAARSPGTNNGPALLPSVVINEIMPNPISGLDEDQYVELFNRSNAVVDLSGWRFTSGIDFTFPANTLLPAQACLVVAKNAARLRTNYANLTAANCLGDFGGKLSHGGERLALAMPHADVVTNGTQWVTNVMFIDVSEVTYQTGGRWPPWADGGGSSLELIDPDADPRLAANWADSDESAKPVPWTTVEYTGPLGETQNYPSNNNLHVYLLGAGECLVDDVEVRTNSAANLVANADFSGGISGWTPQGAYDQSTVETGGTAGSLCLHVRGSSRGDPGANKIRSPAFQVAGTVTLRCKARWLRGWPELLLRLHGGGAEAFGRLPVPANLGTPGAPNSRRVANAGPALWEVQHAPVLPVQGQPVVVTARAAAPHGLASVSLRYRVDPSPGFNEVLMRDDGVGADAVAGDGIFSATIPGLANGALAAFHIRAVDQLGTTNTFPRTVSPGAIPARLFPSDATSRECLVRFGEPQMGGGFGTYHLWLTQANRNRWTSRDALNNAAVDVTFVYNNCRVVYNAGALYSGSPFHASQMDTGPDGTDRCDYVVDLPEDDRVLGETGLNLALPGNGSAGNSSDPSAVTEQTCFLLFRKLGVPFMYRRYIHVFVNGSQRSTISSLTGNFVYEDTQQPGGAFLQQWFPDDPDGPLLKLDDWFEFNDAATSFKNNDADLTRRVYSGTTNFNFAPYRFMWRPRSVNAGDSANDYTNFLTLLTAVSPTTVNTAPLNFPLVNDLADLRQWFREFAAQRIVGNYDSYGWDRGKNSFLYQPRSGRFVFLPFDVDQEMGTGGSRATNASIYGASDARVVVMQQTPVLQRGYLRAFREVLDGPMRAGSLETSMDEKAAAFTANGVTYSQSTLTSVKSWIALRRAYLEGVLAAAQTNFSILSPANGTLISNLVTLTGTAPFQVADIRVNGQSCLVNWLPNNAWSATLALHAGTNLLNIAGFDDAGALLTNATAALTIQVPGTNASPVSSVVLSEILATPALAGAAYVELANTAPGAAFDLSGWRVNGLGYTFPAGTVLGPRAYLVLAQDRVAFNAAYGPAVPVFATFPGALQAEGETLSLLAPDASSPDGFAVVDRVRYEAAAPWPAPAPGTALQLVDPAQDHARVANWAVGDGSGRPAQSLALLAYTNAWRFMQVSNLDGVNWTANAFNDAAWPAGPGLLAFENNTNITPLIRTGLNDPRTATNGLSGGHAYYFRTRLVLTNDLTGWTLRASAYVDDGLVLHVNGREAQRVRIAPGIVVTNLTFTTGQPPSGDAIAPDLFALDPALFVAGTNVLAVEVHQNQAGSSDITFGLQLTADFAGDTNPLALATPGAANSVAATLPAFPPLWLNEAQPDNLTGPLDNAGRHAPWVELVNTGSNALPLAGYYLTDTYTNLQAWPFPAGATVPAGGFLLVWCDGQTNQSAAGAPHANFRLAAGAGQLALSRAVSNTVQLVDYLNYTNLPANWSYGDVPDAQPFYRGAMFRFTPGATNNAAAAPLIVFINEWMADNTVTLADPADGHFEDWFELYNPGTNAVDLGGYYLTDTLTNQFQFRIPDNGRYVIPPGGFLRVWADGETKQNATNQPDLHVNFKLDKAGEALGLFAADGTAIDAVTFGPQTSDVSEGRWPDGGPTIFPMPEPTPGAANRLLNTAPQLAPLADRYACAGQTLRVVCSATDAESAVQTLTFSLDPGAPAGAGVSPAGLFTWPLTNAPLAATNLLTVRVTDDGLPPLSATQLLRVIVVPPPELGPVEPLGDGTVRLSFATVPGQTYRVEYQDQLDGAAWTPLGLPLSGDGTPQSVPDDLAGHPQRFYRLLVLP